jgi:hypothetical protein
LTSAFLQDIDVIVAAISISPASWVFGIIIIIFEFE